MTVLGLTRDVLIELKHDFREHGAHDGLMLLKRYERVRFFYGSGKKQ